MVKLRNEDKLSTEDISKTVGKSKSVIHCDLRKLDETGSRKSKKPPNIKPSKTTTGEADGLVMNENLLIKISSHTISRRLHEKFEQSTKPYISKENEMNRLKFATEHVIWTVGLCSFKQWLKV